MMMKWMMAGLILSLAAGCAHPPQSVELQDGEIESYQAMALRALNSPGAWRQHQALMTFTERKVDANRKAWFDIRPGAPPIVTVWIPTTETDRTNPYVVFVFNHWTHALQAVTLGSINH